MYWNIYIRALYVTMHGGNQLQHLAEEPADKIFLLLIPIYQRLEFLDRHGGGGDYRQMSCWLCCDMNQVDSTGNISSGNAVDHYSSTAHRPPSTQCSFVSHKRESTRKSPVLSLSYSAC